MASPCPLSLPPAAEGSGCIYKAEQLDAQRPSACFIRRRALRVAVRGWHTKVALNIVFGIFSLLLTDYRNRHTVEHGNTAYDRPVILEITVSVKFDKLVKYSVDIVKSRRTVGFPGEKNRIPSCFFMVFSCF